MEGGGSRDGQTLTGEETLTQSDGKHMVMDRLFLSDFIFDSMVKSLILEFKSMNKGKTSFLRKK